MSCWYKHDIDMLELLMLPLAEVQSIEMLRSRGCQYLTGMRTISVCGSRRYYHLLNLDRVRYLKKLSESHGCEGCFDVLELLILSLVRVRSGEMLRLHLEDLFVSHRCEDCFDMRKSLMLPLARV
jgi:hypothetical protein